MYPTLKVLFAEDYEVMTVNTMKKLRRREKEENENSNPPPHPPGQLKAGP